MTLTVGQKLWFVSSDRHRKSKGFEVTVLKVGRKWAQISYHMRIDIVTMWVDGKGFSSPGHCWLSETEWQLEHSRQLAWSQLRDEIRNQYGIPDHLGTAEIEIMRERLTGVKPHPDFVLEEIGRLAQLVTKEDVLRWAETKQ